MCVTAKRSQSLNLIVVWCYLEQTRERLGIGAPGSTTHVAADAIVRRQQVVNDVGG